MDRQVYAAATGGWVRKYAAAAFFHTGQQAGEQRCSMLTPNSTSLPRPASHAACVTSCAAPQAAPLAAHARIKQLQLPRDRQAPLVLDLCLILSPWTQHVRLGASFTKAFLTVDEQPPDANRGFDIPAALMTYWEEGPAASGARPSLAGVEGLAGARAGVSATGWQAWGVAVAGGAAGGDGEGAASDNRGAQLGSALATPLLQTLSQPGPQQVSACSVSARKWTYVRCRTSPVST